MMDVRVKYTTRVSGANILAGDYTAARGNALADAVAQAVLASGAGVDITKYPVETIAKTQTDPTTGQTVIVGPDGEAIPLGGDGLPVITIPPGQPAKITDAVINAGTPLAPISGWTVAGSGVSGTDYSVDSAYSGFDANNNPLPVQSRTGASAMLKLKGLTNTGTPRIQLTGNLGVFNGLFGVWVYIERNPTGDPQPSGNLQISIAFSTSSASLWDRVSYAFTSNGLKTDGWNFLAIARSVDPTSNTDKERHPFGITETINAFADSAWVTAITRGVFIDITNKQGWTLYFDRAFVNWEAEPQFVIGADVAGLDTRDHFLRLMTDNGWGNRGYLAVPNRVSGYSELNYMTPSIPNEYIGMQAAKDAGWDLINHSVNHMPAATLTAPQIRFEIEGNRAWHHAQGYFKGQEFYASPTSSTSIISRKVIADCGIKLQRHSMRDATHVTAYGVDNMNFIGSVDIGGNQWLLNGSDATLWPYNYNHITNLRNWVDMIIKYKATGFAFFHSVTTLGDPGDGTGNSGDSVTMYESTLRLFLEHLKLRESEGKCKIAEGISGWYYGIGA